MTRREFLAILSGAAVSSIFGARIHSRMPGKIAPADTTHIRRGVPTCIAHIEGGSVFDRTTAAVDALGGIARFVKPGDAVVIKPNAAFAQTPPMGGNTTPDVLRAVARLCVGARAGSVTVAEHCLSAHGMFGTDRDLSGLTKAALAEGARVLDAGSDPANYTEAVFDAPDMRSHGFIGAFLDADVVINVPRAKTHPWAGYTLCVKNLMGTMRNPGSLHAWKEWGWIERHYRGILDRLRIRKSRRGYNALPLNLVALARFMQDRVDLNIVDMTDLVRDWSAAKAGTLEHANAIVAGTDMVAADAYCVGIFGEDPLGEWKNSPIDNYIAMIHAEGIGNADTGAMTVIHDMLEG